MAHYIRTLCLCMHECDVLQTQFMQYVNDDTELRYLSRIRDYIFISENVGELYKCNTEARQLACKSVCLVYTSTFKLYHMIWGNSYDSET